MENMIAFKHKSPHNVQNVFIIRFKINDWEMIQKSWLIRKVGWHFQGGRKRKKGDRIFSCLVDGDNIFIMNP